MPGNPKTSEWYATPESARQRKRLAITLPPELIERVRAEGTENGKPMSEIVEDALLAYLDSGKRPKKK